MIVNDKIQYCMVQYDTIQHYRIANDMISYSCAFPSVSEFSHQFDHMREEEAEEVLKFFILPFLSRNSSGEKE